MKTANSPIFVVGCPRSGTTLLYHMLLSAGKFAIYRAETHVFNVFMPHFGNVRSPRARTKLIDEWLKTDYFRCTGLSASTLRDRILANCRNGGDFLRIVMGDIAEQQGASRWGECTPEHLLYIDKIKRDIPDAKVIHVIRDGRDVAVSLDRQRWIRPFPWDKKQSLLVAGLYWEWMLEKGRKLGSQIRPDYMEVRFERLVAHPREELRVISAFIEQELDYDQILRCGVGSVKHPNTSFPNELKGPLFNPVGRWKGREAAEIRNLENTDWSATPCTRISSHARRQPAHRPEIHENAYKLPN